MCFATLLTASLVKILRGEEKEVSGGGWRRDWLGYLLRFMDDPIFTPFITYSAQF
jgi:hypothetical protein